INIGNFSPISRTTRQTTPLLDNVIQETGADEINIGNFSPISRTTRQTTPLLDNVIQETGADEINIGNFSPISRTTRSTTPQIDTFNQETETYDIGSLSLDDLIDDAPVLKKAKVSGDNENESSEMEVDQAVPDKTRSTTPQLDSVIQETGTYDANIGNIGSLSLRSRTTRSTTRKSEIVDPESGLEEKDFENISPTPRPT
ncbi:hypothetical protein PRIPAC_74249, partial [Pristionchus pacificus]